MLSRRKCNFKFSRWRYIPVSSTDIVYLNAFRDCVNCSNVSWQTEITLKVCNIKMLDKMPQ